MTKFGKLLILGTVSLVAIIAFVFIYKPKASPESSELPETEEPNPITLSDITPPPGWFAHQINDNFILLTKQEELPDIGATEYYAYGEQIGINLVEINQSSKEWINQKTFIDLDNTVLVLESEWGFMGEYPVLRVRQNAAGVNGQQLSYYVFSNGKVYIASLWPLDYAESVKSLEQLLINFVKVPLLYSIDDTPFYDFYRSFPPQGKTCIANILGDTKLDWFNGSSPQTSYNELPSANVYILTEKEVDDIKNCPRF